MKESLTEKRPLEHLNEGVKPIMTCVGSFNDFRGVEISLKHPEHINNDFLLVNLQNVDWVHGTYGTTKTEDSLSAGPSTYIISAVDASNKFSKEYKRCTGLIVVGIDKNTKENVSFSTHQDPNYFLYEGRDEFIRCLTQRLKEIKDRCELSTVDAVIVGGFCVWDDDVTPYKKKYLDSIQLLLTKTKEILGFNPRVTGDPKTNGGGR